MLLESSFIPFPSEVIMVPAGYLAFKGEMNFVIVILCELIDSLAGALINYYFAKSLGREYLLSYGSYVMFKEETLLKMEGFLSRHGHISTLPAVNPRDKTAYFNTCRISA